MKNRDIMKATKIFITCCLLAFSVCAGAQQREETVRKARVEAKGDSVVIHKGDGDMMIKLYENQGGEGEDKLVKIYEGVFLEKVDADNRTFFDALPFIPKKKKNNNYDPHLSGLYLGFARMSDSFMGFGASRKAGLDLFKSWEFGFTPVLVYHNFKKNPHWGLNTGASWGYRSFSFDGNYALVKKDGMSVLQDGSTVSDNPDYYSSSRLRYFFFRIPVQLEWQQKLGYSRRLFFFNFGPEFEIRHGVKSFTHINDGKKKNIGKGMYVQPIGVNLLFQAGYGDLGFYLRYSATRLFQRDKGMEVTPFSFGISWFL